MTFGEVEQLLPILSVAHFKFDLRPIYQIPPHRISPIESIFIGCKSGSIDQCYDSENEGKKK